MYTGIIYKYTSPSNKVYIGQTINEYNRKNAFKNIKHLYAGGKIDKARLKYGPDNFQYEVLETIEKNSKKELLETLNNLEVQYITKYDSFKSGYNSTPGGQYLYEYTSIDKQKISDSKVKAVVQYSLEGDYIATYKSSKQAQKFVGINYSSITKCCSGKYTHGGDFLWKYLEDFEEGIPQLKITGLSEDKINTIKSAQQCMNTTDSKTYKKVIQYSIKGDFIQIFDSLTNAAKSVGLTNTTSITQSCSSGGCSKGYFWRYYTENYPKNIDVKVSKHCLATIKHKNIYQYTLDKHLVNTYHSYKEAAESVNAHSSGISLCYRGLQKTCKGYLWEEDYDIG